MHSFVQFKSPFPLSHSLFPPFIYTFRYTCPSITYTYKGCFLFTMKRHRIYKCILHAVICHFYIHIFKVKKVKDAQHSKDRELTKTDTYMSLNLFLSELPHIIFHLYDHIKFLQPNYLQHAYCVDPLFTNKEHIFSFKVCSHMVSSWKDGFIIAILTHLCKEMLP